MNFEENLLCREIEKLCALVDATKDLLVEVAKHLQAVERQPVGGGWVGWQRATGDGEPWLGKRGAGGPFIFLLSLAAGMGTARHASSKDRDQQGRRRDTPHLGGNVVVGVGHHGLEHFRVGLLRLEAVAALRAVGDLEQPLCNEVLERAALAALAKPALDLAEAHAGRRLGGGG